MNADSDNFPSGPWTGFYQYPGGSRGGQDLVLTFAQGRMMGAGQDELGGFEVRGHYDDASKEAEWVKSYPDGHFVNYRGFREGPVPGIWGTWDIPGVWSGGFHIWPLTSASGSEEAEESEALKETPSRKQPVMVPQGSVTPR